jgi:hypothetical protein
MAAPILYAVGMFIQMIYEKVIAPLIPVTIYGFFVVLILTLCMVIAGLGGSLLFYIILFFYVKALLSYNPVLEARQQAVEAAQMNQGAME